MRSDISQDITILLVSKKERKNVGECWIWAKNPNGKYNMSFGFQSPMTENRDENKELIDYETSELAFKKFIKMFKANFKGDFNKSTFHIRSHPDLILKNETILSVISAEKIKLDSNFVETY